MSPVVLLTGLIAFFFVTFEGVSSRCGTLNLVCKCGKDPRPGLWKVDLCPNKNLPGTGYLIFGEFADDLQYCAKFANCEECYPHGDVLCKSCPFQKFGKFCEEDCDCKNGASCTIDGKCACPTGYEGQKCEYRKDCGCMNGGSCTADGRCLCTKDFKGPNCEYLTNCRCMNGGSCTIDGKCLCTKDFKGPNCEYLTNCGCMNGGSCTTDGGCLCSKDFKGPNCEYLTNCRCLNGGSCTTDEKCVCSQDFKGRNCEYNKRCGEPIIGRTPLIKYGSRTEIGKWPWQAAVFICDGKGTDDSQYPGCWFNCGGSLLNNLWVMTAANCITNYPDSSDARPARDVKIFLGKYYRQISKDDKYVQEKEVDTIYIHPNYNQITLDADIGLIKLKTPVQMNARIQPVCLPTVETYQRNIVPGNNGVIIGWGQNEAHQLTETLLQAVAPIVPTKYCETGIRPFTMTENMFCTGRPDPSASEPFFGDGGGPLLFRDQFEKGTPYVVEGILNIVRGTYSESGKTYRISGYTKVSKFLGWIQSYLEVR